MFYQRTIEKTLQSVSESFPVLLLTGPRQVGKTTVLEKLIKAEKTESAERKTVSLDNPTIRALAKKDPEMFLQRYAPPVFIDEVQYAPELFDYIKIYADKHRRSGDFWLTGSQTFHLMKDVTQSLAGRVGVVRMLGLSNSEITGNHFAEFTIDPKELLRRAEQAKPMNINQVFERIFKGAMPRMYEIDTIKRDEYFESYLETYIGRDIKDLSQVADELSFLNFIGIVAARTATNVNYEALANEAGISAPTAKQWLSVLVSSGLVALIPPYSNNALKRVIKAPRMYFLDTGLCSYITRWSSAEILERGAMDGQFFETWVVSEIYKSYLHNGKRPPLYFYRDSNKKEIDLIIAQNGEINPVEIKKGSAPKDAIRHFSVLKPIEQEPDESDVLSGAAHLKTTLGTGAVVCMPSDIMPIDKNNWYVPAWLI
ncbi:MAG: ATP-binding protein [Oscillospiraceae bacterium]|nr:ATP-binding protein [Oscillospiraceae bacterium]